FLPTTFKIGGTSQMTIKFTNSDADNAVTVLQILDDYPISISNAGLVRNTCGGLLAFASDIQSGDFALFLMNGTIPAGGSCSVVVNVVGVGDVGGAGQNV